MKNETKANKARTCLLLKIESEVEHFKSIKTKINSISPYIYYNMYSNIEINIENPCEFFFNKRKSSIDFLMEKNLTNKESKETKEIGNITPIDEIEYKINKKLISDRKIHNYDDNNNINLDKSPFLKLSQDTNDTSVSLNTPFDSFNNKKNNRVKSSIQFLRQFAKNFIKRKKTTVYINSFCSQKDLTIVRKNSKKNEIEITKKNKSSKNVNILKKNFPIKNEKTSQLVHANSTSFKNNNIKNKCKNLLLDNNNIITCDGPSFNRKTFSLMNIHLEKEKLLFQQQQSKKELSEMND